MRQSRFIFGQGAPYPAFDGLQGCPGARAFMIQAAASADNTLFAGLSCQPASQFRPTPKAFNRLIRQAFSNLFVGLAAILVLALCAVVCSGCALCRPPCLAAPI